jgi:hypothetical protein
MSDADGWLTKKINLIVEPGTDNFYAIRVREWWE